MYPIYTRKLFIETKKEWEENWMCDTADKEAQKLQYISRDNIVTESWIDPMEFAAYLFDGQGAVFPLL